MTTVSHEFGCVVKLQLWNKLIKTNTSRYCFCWNLLGRILLLPNKFQEKPLLVRDLLELFKKVWHMFFLLIILVTICFAEISGNHRTGNTHTEKMYVLCMFCMYFVRVLYLFWMCFVPVLSVFYVCFVLLLVFYDFLFVYFCYFGFYVFIFACMYVCVWACLCCFWFMCFCVYFCVCFCVFFDYVYASMTWSFSVSVVRSRKHLLIRINTSIHERIANPKNRDCCPKKMMKKSTYFIAL